MNWILIIEVFYLIIVILVCLRVIYDTRSKTKTSAYLLLVIFLPVIGMIIYFSFGVNYRKRKIYSKKIFSDIPFQKKLEKQIRHSSSEILANGDAAMVHYHKLATLILEAGLSPLTDNNDVKLLLNGEEKFPAVLEALKNAKNHIHFEYYIFNDDTIGTAIIDLLIEKAQQGVKVRFVYDDFGSRDIRKKQVPRLKAAGVEAFPFYKINFIALANRLNYRNHRKIIVVDGSVGFVGGINVSDKYINNDSEKQKLFWRDTHLKIQGPAVSILQYIFMADWNYCSGEKLEPTRDFFPDFQNFKSEENKIVQIVASGPDSDMPLIQYSLMQAINVAEKEILITTPYLIPGESVMDSLILAASSGTKVKLLVPGKSDSLLVNLAVRSYYGMLLNVGVEIYCYQKGFVHAKTMVVDSQLAIVGTANMDIRSFDLNFEVNALVYNREIALELREAFYEDIIHSTKIDPERWKGRSLGIQLLEKFVGILSPML